MIFIPKIHWNHISNYDSSSKLAGYYEYHTSVVAVYLCYATLPARLMVGGSHTCSGSLFGILKWYDRFQRFQAQQSRVYKCGGPLSIAGLTQHYNPLLLNLQSFMIGWDFLVNIIVLSNQVITKPGLWTGLWTQSYSDSDQLNSL